jgi:hypothetical protein
VDLRGYGGTLAVGYQRAATIRAWALQFDPQHQRGVVTVTYGGIDTFWIQQRPLDLTLHIEGAIVDLAQRAASRGGPDVDRDVGRSGVRTLTRRREIDGARPIRQARGCEASTLR